VLILDEPTNDLSLEVVEVLEEMLQVGRRGLAQKGGALGDHKHRPWGAGSAC
jgi:hypothetical protein